VSAFLSVAGSAVGYFGSSKPENASTFKVTNPSCCRRHQSAVVSKKQLTKSHSAGKSAADEDIFSRESLDRASAEFLKIDVQTALTFMMIARQTQDNSRQQRNLRAARKAYDTVLRLRNRILLNEEDARELTSGLKKLRSELEQFGEAF
jgi:aspartyl-tRNA synthetase